MATLKFVLNKSQHQKKINSLESMLFLRYTHDKKVTLFTTQKNIQEQYWDDKNQKVKRSYSGSIRFNIYLNKLKEKVENIVNGLLIEETNPSTQLVKRLYKESLQERQQKEHYSLMEYIEYFIETGRKYKKKGTVKSYQTTFNQLKKYQKYAGVELDWKDIDMNFYYNIYEFYTEIQNFTNNGFGKIIKNLKVILNEATEKGINTNLAYKNRKFKTLKEEVNNVYLTEEELTRIMDLNLSYSKSLDRIRDLFIVGCYTGLRFSDFSQIKPENIQGNMIKIKTIKTGNDVTIPVVDQLLLIMKKYKNRPNSLPKSCTNQTLNKHIKQICKMAKINNKVLKIRNSGKKRIEESLYKYELVSSHTARRSFATNMFKRGIPSRIIMRITGHKTEKAFSSYIQITDEENAKLMMEYLKYPK